jgi:hypothetical protein
MVTTIVIVIIQQQQWSWLWSTKAATKEFITV